VVEPDVEAQAQLGGSRRRARDLAHASPGDARLGGRDLVVSLSIVWLGLMLAHG